MTLPTQAAQRKAIPVATGCFDYFPKALASVAELSRIGNDQHNPGAPLHWDRSKSTDEADALARHFLERGTVDSDGVRHSAKVAWRALALLEKEIENADTLSADIARECAGVFSAAEAKQIDEAGTKFYEDRFRPDSIYATDSETGAKLPLDGILTRLFVFKPPVVTKTFDVWRYGFQLGEIVNTPASAPGQYPGEVVGFDDNGHVEVLWEHCDRIAKWDPKDLRHGP